MKALEEGSRKQGDRDEILQFRDSY
jgi:hypothetical protein